MTSLTRLLELLAETSKRATRDTELRDRLILQLFERDVSLRRIGQAAGLSHERVRNIVEQRRHRPRPIRVD